MWLRNNVQKTIFTAKSRLVTLGTMVRASYRSLDNSLDDLLKPCHVTLKTMYKNNVYSNISMSYSWYNGTSLRGFVRWFVRRFVWRFVRRYILFYQQALSISVALPFYFLITESIINYPPGALVPISVTTLLDIKEQFFGAPPVVRTFWYVPPYHAKRLRTIVGLRSSGAKTCGKRNESQTGTKVPFAGRERTQTNHDPV
jgi:hypothetical protein